MQHNGQTKADILRVLKENANFKLFLEIIQEDEVEKLRDMLLVKNYGDIHEFNRDRDTMNVTKKFLTIIDSYIKKFESEEDGPRKDYEVYELAKPQ